MTKKRKSKKYKIGTEIGNRYQGTGKRKFKEGFFTELYYKETKKKAYDVRRVLKKMGHRVHILKKEDGYSVYYK